MPTVSLPGPRSTSTTPRHRLTPIIIIAALAGTLIGWGVISLIVHANTPHGSLHFDASVPATTQAELADLLSDLDLWQDLTISTTRTTEPQDAPLLNLYLPVTGFYNPVSDLTTEQFTELKSTFDPNNLTLPTSESTDLILVPLQDLTADLKLLSVDGAYYLDTLNSGALFEYLTFSGDPETVAAAQERAQALSLATPTTDTTLSLAQTGVTALSRGMYTKLQQVGDASYFAANLADYLSQFDLTHTSNEASFSSSANSENICSDPTMLSALTAIGLDIVELTGNHNQDCGDEAALTSLDLYHSLGI